MRKNRKLTEFIMRDNPYEDHKKQLAARDLLSKDIEDFLSNMAKQWDNVQSSWIFGQVCADIALENYKKGR